VIRDSIWGSPYVSFPDLIAVKFRVFEIGSVIGVSMSGRLRAVVRMLGWPGEYDRLLDDLLTGAQTQLAEALSAAPEGGYESLLDLFRFVELEARGSPPDALLRWRKKKIELELAAELTGIPFLTGLGMGAGSPRVIETCGVRPGRLPIAPTGQQHWTMGYPLPPQMESSRLKTARGQSRSR
jgi:hypothetical protein